jgi:hypothetical protein
MYNKKRLHEVAKQENVGGKTRKRWGTSHFATSEVQLSNETR